MPSPAIPPVDQRIIRIFLSVAKVPDFMKRTRRCEVRGFHQPHVDAGQNAAKPWQVFTVSERCVGRDGRRCSNHGLEFSLQLSDEQRVRAIYQLVQLDPFPYNSEPLLDYCVKYLSLLHDLVPPLSDVAPPFSATGTAEGVATGRALQPKRRTSTTNITQHSTSHDVRYAGWVSRLIPQRSTIPAASRPPARRVPALESLTSCSSFAVTVKLNNAYCYTKNARPPVTLCVEAKKQDHMVYVSLRQDAILSAFGLKRRVRHLAQKLQVYDALGEKWFHSPAETLWLRLNVNEALILKTSDVHITPGLDRYILKSLTKPQHHDTLTGFLASTRASINSIPPFCPVPPLTVMVATIPEDDVAVFSSRSASSSLPVAEGSRVRTTESSSAAATQGGTTRVTKKQKRNDGSSTQMSAEIIDISSDEESNPALAAQPAGNRESYLAPASQTHRKRVVVHPSPPRLVLPNTQKPAKPQVSYWKLIPRATKPTKNPEVIVISDDESATPMQRSTIVPSSSRQAACVTGDSTMVSNDRSPGEALRRDVPVSSRRQGYAQAVGSGAGEVNASGCAGPSAGTRNATRQHQARSEKGKGKMRAQDEDEDGDVDSDATLC